MKTQHRAIAVPVYATCLILVVVLAALGLHAGATQVSACSCVGLTPAEALERADTVFTGEVISVKTRGGLFGQSGLDPVTVKVEVRQVWKGPHQATHAIKTVRSEASCGFEFEQGREYLIYALDGGTGFCDRTAEVGRASEDLAVLGAGWQPTTGADSTGASSGPWGGVCGAAQGAGNRPLDLTALGMLVGVALLGASPKRRL